MKPPRQNRFRPRPAAAKSSWEGVADWYASYLAKPGTVQANIVFPGAARLLAPESRGRYLDIACGEGRFAHQIARNAKEVVGVDAAPSLIARAKQGPSKNTRFIVADAQAFARTVHGPPFDGASCILAIQNIPNMRAVFEQAAAVLAPDAPLVIVMNHPAFRQPRQSGWGWDEQRKLQYRRIDRYQTPYEQPIIAHPGANPDVRTSSFHRPLAEYINALAYTGFVIDAMEEWVSDKQSDSGPRAKAENVARAEIPLFLALRARRRT